MTPKPPGAPDSDPAFRAALVAHQAGRIGEAESLYEAIVQRNRRHFPALVMLSALKAQKGDYGAAEQLVRAALKLQPRDLRALMQQAQILLAQERHDDAFAAFADVLAQNPSIPEAHANRGAILMLWKRYGEALDCFDAALRVRPDFAPALCNRGNALQELNRLAEALASYEAALRVQRSNPEYLASRANCLYRMRRFEEALADLDAALKLQPRNPEFLYNKGNVLSQLKKLEEASAAYDAAYRIAPALDYVEGDRLFTKLNLCDWRDLETETQSIRRGVEEGQAVARPFVILAITSSTALQVECAQQFMQREFPPQAALSRGGEYTHDRIRVAYLSADLRDHPVAHLMAGVFERHDRAHFEVSAYSFGASEPTPMQERLKAAFEHFHDVREISDRDIALLMREHEIDIAIDLMGPTQNARPGILAYRPAPVQALYLGYAGSSGAPFIDYVLADRIVIPADQRVLYPERIVDLPVCFMATDSARPIADAVPRRADEGLPEHGFVFCAFSNAYKISPALFDLWIELLRDV
ncbi:MAG TPA: tetratricopeptide repeat protein, partial [Xanthobacteraceae bacterium]